MMNRKRADGVHFLSRNVTELRKFWFNDSKVGLNAESYADIIDECL